MYKHSFFADRKLAKCLKNDGTQVGNDRYTELKNVPYFEDIWSKLDQNEILKINGENIRRDGNRFKFKIKDQINNRLFSANLALLKGGTTIRLRLGEYADSINLTVGQIITISASEVVNRSCSLEIKAEWIFKYIFERIQTGEYILRSQSCSNLSPDLELLNFLEHFGIIPTGLTEEVGRDAYPYSTYEFVNSEKKFIGIPFTTELEAKFFNHLDEKILS